MVVDVLPPEAKPATTVKPLVVDSLPPEAYPVPTEKIPETKKPPVTPPAPQPTKPQPTLAPTQKPVVVESLPPEARPADPTQKPEVVISLPPEAYPAPTAPSKTKEEPTTPSLPATPTPEVVHVLPSNARPANTSEKSAYNVLDVLNNIVRPSSLLKGLTLQFNPVLGRVVAFLRDDVESVTLTEDVAYMMGFTDPTLIHDTVASAPADVTNGRGLLMCYASICDYTICGNKQVNLLRTFIYSNESNTFSLEFLHTRFVPVRESQIDNISIKILDSLGRKIPFSGVAVVTLEFKRV